MKAGAFHITSGLTALFEFRWALRINVHCLLFTGYMREEPIGRMS